MSRSVIAAAVVSLVVLTGCGGTNEPSAPPPSEDALTTATATTEPDVAVETTETAPTTEAPEETDAPASEEMDQTEAGAEAFVEHYVERLNAAYVSGDASELAALATENCDSCEALADGVSEEGLPSDYLEFVSASAELLDGSARVTTDLEQLSGDGAGSGTLVFRLVPDQEAWLVDSITLVE